MMKNTVIKILSLAMVMLIGAGMANAQFRQSVYLNGNIPTGSFASDVSSNALQALSVGTPLGNTEMGKDAVLGFGAGYRASYRFDIGMGEVAPFAGADFFWNMIGGDLRDKYMDLDYKTPTYINVPILGGVTYIYDELFRDIALYGEFGIGADILFITREGDSDYKENLRAYSASTSMAWMLGAGAYFGRHVSAGLYYYGLGTHPIDYTKSTLENSNAANLQNAAQEANHSRQKRTVGSLALRIGFHF